MLSDRNVLDAPELGIEVVAALWKLYPDKFQIDRVDRLLLNKGVLDQIEGGTDPRAIASDERKKDLSAYKARRQLYLLYK